VLVAGEINPDLVLSGNVHPEFGQVEKIVENATLTVGSSSVIFACGAARLGLSVAFVGKCGNDPFGRFMLEEMQKRQVDVSNVIIDDARSTGLSVILTDGADRAILTFPGLIAALSANEIPDTLLRQAQHLHVASYFLQKALQAGLQGLFKHALSLGLTTSLDPNYDPRERWAGFDEMLAYTSVFFPNDKEARSVTHAPDLEVAADALRARGGITAIKLGERGAIAVEGARTVKADSIPVDVVDTVGAGDSFDAGFIYGFLHKWSLEASLRLACVCGALSTRASGGTAAQASLEEAQRYA